jgi:ADP-heptose:LPS heptosyltransferase
MIRGIADRVARDQVRLIASASEAAFADAVASATGMHVQRFDQLEPWKAAIAGSRLLVAPDSGALHVAGMIGTPVVAVFPAKDFALQTARWSPWAAPARIIEGSEGWPKRVVDSISSLSADVAANP